MPRAATTTDVFNAIAEPRRRELIGLLARSPECPRPVNDLVDLLGIPQPAVSKHLAVLRRVGLVTVARRGRSRLYQLKPEKLKPVQDWLNTFERFWTHQVDQIKQQAERRADPRVGPADRAVPPNNHKE